MIIIICKQQTLSKLNDGSQFQKIAFARTSNCLLLFSHTVIFTNTMWQVNYVYEAVREPYFFNPNKLLCSLIKK
ncbi:unnamed protein product [Rotaria socialis]